MASTPSTSNTTKSKSWWLYLRIVIGIVLIAALVPMLADPAFWTTLRSVNVPLVLLALVFDICSVTSKAWRWGIVMRSRGINRPISYLLSSYYVGMFFNNFLPSGMGGDFVRAYEMARETGKGKESVVSVIIERGSGMLAVFGAGSLFALTMTQAQLQLGVTLLAHGLFLGSLIAIAALWLDITGRILAAIGKRLPKRLMGMWAKLTSVYEEFRSYRQQWGLLGSIMLQSLITLVFTLAAVYTLLLAFNVPVNFGEFAAIFSILTAIDIVPISLNGLGVRENAYVYFFGLISVNAAVALGVALLIRLLVLIQAAFGGITYLWRNFQSNKVTVKELDLARNPTQQEP
jgi:glycosyltransferase 2 family protein